MSVEQGEESPNLSVSHLPNTSSSQEEPLQNAASIISTTLLDLEPKVETDKGATDGDAKFESLSWFQSLSANERAVALGFIDGAFLTAFLAMVPPPSAGATRSEGPHSVEGIDWDAQVAILEVESALPDYMSSLRDKEGPEPLCVDSSPNVDDETMKFDDAATASKQILDSDVFRIRSWESTTALRSLLGHVCLVFPSAIKHVSGKTVDQHFPFVTLSPSYLENTSDEELFLSLGAVRSYGCGSPLLSCDLFRSGIEEDALLAPWLKRFVRVSTDEKIPLFALLLARFEYAIFEAYRHRIVKAGIASAATPSTGESQQTDSAEAQNAVHLEQEGCVSRSEPQTNHFPLSFIIDVRSNAKTLHNLFLSIDAAVLADCVGPFVDTFLSGMPFQPSTHGSENLILTPFHYLGQAKKHDDFEAFDCAIGKSLRRIHEFAVDAPMPSDEAVATKLVSSSSTTSVASNNQTPPRLCPTPVPGGVHGHTGGKKKKKKNKRRKSRKLTSDQVAPASKTSVPAETQTPAETHTLAETPAPAEMHPVTMADVSTEKPTVGVALADVTVEVVAEDELQEKVSCPISMDSEDTEMSTVPETTSVKSEASNRVPNNAVENDSITIARVEGVMLVAPPVANTQVVIDSQRDEDADECKGCEDGDTWETVEVRARGNRKKSLPGQQNGRNSLFSHAGSFGDSGCSSKKKSVRTAATRKKSANRKIVRDVVYSLLDSVEEEVKRRQQQPPQPLQHQPLERPPAVSNSWKNGPPLSKGAPVIASQRRQQQPLTNSGSASPPKKQATMRDVVLGRHTAVAPVTPVKVRRPVPIANVRNKETDTSNGASSPSKSTASRAKVNTSSGADQNTAPTYQETMSASSIVHPAAKSDPASHEERASKSDTSSVDTDEAPQNQARLPPSSHNANHPGHVPPLPTLLSAENANSANSSVASSLEVPHSSRRHHHGSSADVNDVGYHLLDVCDRLSRDMSLFMSRRALALNARRRERGALLTALQSTVASLWPSRGHVEMYGSCATQLDLPSSDLDVVIIGLDRNVDIINGGNLQPDALGRSKSLTLDGVSRSQSLDEEIVDETQPPSRHVSLKVYPSIHLPKNAERVVRLAAELETQPWAVQIKSIPTAAVPVIKILADPSKLKGTDTGGEWMVRHRHLAAQAAAAAGSHASGDTPLQCENMQHFHPPWRGADVMNGLLKLDITFEGPEHGGIGSTQFSAQVIAEASQEAGVHPDATALVQVVMVLKEILAQRKLNEPYSGGLSSYALLLLVVALVQERAFIREEIERAERQRQAMAYGESTASFTSPTPTYVPNASATSSCVDSSSMAPNVNLSWAEHAKVSAATSDNIESSKVRPKAAVDAKKVSKKPNKPPEHSAKLTPTPSLSSQKSTGSSWASIAKKSSVSQDPNAANSNKAPVESKPSTVQSKPSFADAVARSVVVSKSSTQKPSNAKPSTRSFETGNEDKKGVANEAGTSTYRATSEETSTPNVSSSVFPSRVAGAVEYSPSFTVEAPSIGAPSFYPQGYNDVIEVLCSGETTAGKLLMHFLLYYGQHFDAQSTAIDISGKHERDYGGHFSPYSYYSPFITRRSAGVIDPITGMLTVDPIVIYDPLQGAENNNVARRCFAWSSVRWVFAQSYATLSSAVERSATPPATPGGAAKCSSASEVYRTDAAMSPCNAEAIGDLMDPSSPLLRCLLSF